MSMEYRNKVRCCLQLVKEHVKQSAIGYLQLAKQLGISEVTIKRQLNADEISMSKLLALCDAAQIDFAEVWSKVGNREATHTVFTTEQDKAFYCFPHLLRYFAELFYHKKTPHEIEDEWGISAASTHLYLRKLEQLKLITLSTHGHPTFLVSEPLGFAGESLNAIRAIQEGLVEVSEKLIEPREDEPFVIVKPTILDAELRKKMYREIKELVSRYAEVSERYYTNSTYPPFQLVICDYKMQDTETPSPEIIEITGFERP